jgi:dipeptidyl aminopeptidase/acylaminoacyl peptidase
VRWSPDGRTLALLFIENLDRPAGALEAAAPDAGEVGEAVYEQRILLVDAETGATRFASPADMYVYEYDWSPDSARIAAVAARGSGDNNWWIARLCVAEAKGGAFREVFKPATQIAVPRWSPDGRSIAFIQGIMSDQGGTGGDIWLVPAGGGEARNLTPGRKSSPAWLAWLPATGRLLFTEWKRGGADISVLDPDTGRAETLWHGDGMFGAGGDILSLSLAADGNASAVFRSSFDRPPEVWSGPIGSWTQRTRLNASAKPSWGRVESVEWTSDGQSVQGWLVHPAKVDPARRHPMIVSIHGGPASQQTPSWPAPWFNLIVMASDGYFVFFPNPRGSYGQGEAFAAANARDFGHGDLRDVLAGVDRVLAVAPVDPQRLGVGGWSYGGYMTMWTVTQTGRFRAAVAGAGIANWQSYFGQNLIDQWMASYFGATVYDDPAAYARCSPIEFVKAVRTPTLVVVGASDKECPAPQSYEFWKALKTLGVKTSLVVYPGEGHHFRKPEHVEDLISRTIRWFNAELGAGGGP